MNVLIIGNRSDKERFKIRFGNTHDLLDLDNFDSHKHNPDLAFWFNADNDPYLFEELTRLEIPLFCDATKTTLYELSSISPGFSKPLFGFCGLSTFFERDIMEVSCHNEEHISQLEKLLKMLGTEFERVEDRIGMITPRTICMIINEAYFTFMEGTASMEDIDTAMKLGTNYPYGPFEWAQKIGLQNVYEVLEALLMQSHDNKYKICPLLAREALS